MARLWQDIRYALRALSKSRGMAVLAILSLGVGIGATTAVFSLFNELVLRPRPGIGNPEELIDIGRSQDGSGFDNMSYPNYADFRDQNQSFMGVLGYCIEPRPVSLSTGDAGERIYAGLVSGNYFDVLQAPPGLGRYFSQEEDRVQGRDPVVVLSHAFWKRRFAGDSTIVGREIRINGHPFHVTGVAPEGFRGTMIITPDVWVPLHTTSIIIPGSRLTEQRLSVWMVAIGRLKSGIALGQARAEALTLGAQLESEYPKENRGKNFALFHSSLFPGEMQTIIVGFLTLLLALCGLILAIVCVNVTGVLLVRASTRQREIAIRLALGASRRQIMSQLSTEALVLFLIGGLAGMFFSVALTGLLLKVIPQLPFPVTVNLSPDWRVWTFAFGVASVAGWLASLAPAAQLLKPNVAGTLRDEAQGAGLRKLRLRNALILGQVALSLILLVCGGLFFRSLMFASRIDSGFDSTHVQTITMNFSLGGYNEDGGLAVSDRIADRVRTFPGVKGIAYTWSIPLEGGNRSLGGFEVPGHAAPEDRKLHQADWSIVSPGYFALLKIPILSGRDFTDADLKGNQRVAIINETMANRFWPGENPVGRSFTATMGPGNEKQSVEIVGLARNHKYRTPAEAPVMFIYVPLRQNYMAEMTLLVRTDGDVPIYEGLRKLIREIDPNLPIIHVQPLGEYARLVLFPQRLAGGLAGSLGLLGLLLTALGIYGVTAFTVVQRTREIGIRLALGAESADVRRMFLAQGLRLILPGLVGGLGIALAATRLLSGLLIGTSTWDPITFIGIPLLLLAVTLAATLVPALKASRIELIRALRHE